MKAIKSWRFLKRNYFSDGVKLGLKMKQLQLMGIMCTALLFIVYRTTYYQYKQTEMESKLNPFDTAKDLRYSPEKINNLPRGILHPTSDLELRPLWSRSKVSVSTRLHLLAIAVGIKLKDNVDIIVQKFLPENFTVILFHYDGNVDGWWDLDWSNKAVHVVAHHQTKWWFAKRFLHPDVVSAYDYIFLWDEDLGVENFDPRSYLYIVRSQGFEISQPALDLNSSDIHHKFTIRSRTKKYHRKFIDRKGSFKCTNSSEGPPCTGFVEGMAPVFSRSAWNCTWHLIQNDLVHGWGLDMKLGYCAQGDRTQNVGVVDIAYVMHQGNQTLGGEPPEKKNDIQTLGREPPKTKSPDRGVLTKKHAAPDRRAEIRRQSLWELQMFKERWNKAIQEDKAWIDPYRKIEKIEKHRNRRRKRRSNSNH